MSTRHILMAGTMGLLLATPLFGWMINEDYQQRDVRPSTDFEIFLVGDVRDQTTGGGQSIVTNPFPGPTRTIELTGIGNTKITFEGSGTIAQNLTTNRHFGVFGTGKKPRVRFKAWSYASSPDIVPVPKSNFDFSYDESSQELTITIENISDDTVTFGEGGYLLSSVERPIEDLVRTTLPPGAFIPLPQLNAEYLVGESRSVVIPGVAASQFALTYATVTFTGSSAGNAYNDFGMGTGGEWAQVAVIDELRQSIPTVSAWGLITMTLLLLTVATVVLRRRGRAAIATAALAGFLLLPAASLAHNRGIHAGDWTAGQVIKICMDTFPGTPQQQSDALEALNEAMAEWNTSKEGFAGGVTFELATTDCDAQISWQANYSRWGSVSRITGPISVIIESNRGLNARGWTRVFKHELGHVKGLGHSPDSVIMKWNYRGSGTETPLATDLNSADPFETPNADDIALNKKLHGTPAEESSKSDAGSSVTPAGTSWNYDYSLEGLTGPSYVDPVTRLTLELPHGVLPGDLVVTNLPPGWQWEFVEGEPEDRGAGTGKPMDTDEGLMATALAFWTDNPASGVQPGQVAGFQITSPLPPTTMRAYTNSPSFDTDEFILAVPGPRASVPTVSEWGLVVMTLLLLTVATVALGRRRRPAAA